MKIIIEHLHTKRVIEGPFNICGDRQDLITLMDAINETLHNSFSYGWVNITEQKQPSLVNMIPEPWEK